MRSLFLLFLIPVFSFAQSPKQLLVSLVNDANNYRLSGELGHYFVDEDDMRALVNKLREVDGGTSTEIWTFLTDRMRDLKKESQASWNKRIRQLSRDSSLLTWMGFEDYMIRHRAFGAIGIAQIYHLPRVEVFDMSTMSVEKIQLTMIELNGKMKIAELRFEPVTSMGFTNAESLAQYLVTSINQKRGSGEVDIMFLSEEDRDSIADGFALNNPEATPKQVKELASAVKKMDLEVKETWDRILPDLKSNLIYKDIQQELATDDALKYRNITVTVNDGTSAEKHLMVAAIEVNGVLRVVKLEHIFPLRLH